jgi:hypothetical protein
MLKQIKAWELGKGGKIPSNEQKNTIYDMAILNDKFLIPSNN